MTRRKYNTMPSVDELLRFTRPAQGGCMEWTRCRDDFGYGMITVFGKSLRAHRLMFRLYSGEVIPPGICVCHNCDNPRCINPKHLFLGTKRDNMEDCVAKRRIAHGKRIGASKLNRSQAEEILRASLGRFDRRKGEFARKFGISVRAVTALSKGESWKYLYAEITPTIETVI